MMFTSIWGTAKLGGMVLAAATVAASGIAVGSVGSSPVLLAPPDEMVVALQSTTDATSDVTSHRRWLIRAAADVLDLDVGEMLDRVVAEGSLGAVADSVGVGAEALIDLLVTDAQDRSARAGSVGLTDRIAGAVDAEVSDLVRHRIERAERRSDRFARAAALLNVTPQELRSAHATDGVHELIVAAGMTVDSFVDLLLAPLAEHLETMVASGVLSEDAAAQRLAGVTSRVVAALSESTSSQSAVAE